MSGLERPARGALAAAVWSIVMTGAGATGAQAAGYALKEQSGSALGTAFAGSTAGAFDPSSMFFNPASLTVHDGIQGVSAVSYIMPFAEPDNMSGSTLAGTPIGGGQGGDDIAADALVPAAYVMVSPTEDLRLGLGVNAPFGLRTEYDRGWVGRYHALDSELRTINLNPTVAYRAAEWLSLGAGVQVQYADAELTNAVDFGTIGAARGVPGAVPGAADGLADLTGDDFGYGFTLGLLFEPSDRTRIGLGYRSQVFHELDGNVDFSGGGAVRPALNAGGAFTDTSASAKLVTPDQASLGVYHELNDQWALMAEVQWTDWSDFQELRVNFDDGTPDSVTEENWNDSLFGAVGVTYRPTEAWALRAGVAFDESPIPDATRTPRIPGADRTWLALGAHWSPASWLTLDAGYTHIFVADSSVNLTPALGDPDASRGNLSGNYDNAIDIVTVQATLRF
jgi:long-chain fatty acid transport protein